MSRPTFERAITELERTIEKLESEDLDLETSIKDFEKGIKIRNYCKKKLEEATLRMNLLLEDQKMSPLSPPLNPPLNPPLSPPQSPRQSPPPDLSSNLFDLD